MIFLFYLVLNVLALFLFAKLKKKLHILEVIVYWLFSSYVFQNFSAICYMNFGTLFVPEIMSNEFAHFLNRMVLYPLLMVTFLNFYLSVDTFWKKLLVTISSIFIFLGLEWLADSLGVLIHVNWRIWWSFAFWLAALLILIGFMKFFRKILYRGRLNL